MKKLLRHIAVLSVGVVVMLSAAACAKLTKSLDVIGNASVTSFEAVLKALPQTADSAQTMADAEFFSIAAPDLAASFLWSSDFKQSAQNDILFKIDAQPFLDAGLKPEELPENYVYDRNTNEITVGTRLGGDVFQYQGEPAPLAAYEQIRSLYPDSISYHAAMDHFGISLGDGNMFEWANDLQTNDKDIVFTMNPEPFLEAGVDPKQVAGWLFDKVPMHMDGKTVEMEKFLKPVDLVKL